MFKLKNHYKKITVGLILIVLIGGGIGFAADEENPMREHATIQNFQNILMIINNYYVEDLSVNKLLTGAIKGMMKEIDSYSTFMTSEEYEDMQEEFEGEFGGIGIVITIRNDRLTIVSPISDTPGERAGLRAGDVIVEINGKPTAEMSQERAVDLMRGEPGTDLVLTIEREDEDELIEVDITRAVIEVPIVETEMYEDNIGYFSISQFLQETAVKTEDAVKELEESGAEALILDLRNNPGGILDEAVDVSSIFAEEGTVLTVQQREGDPQVYDVNPEFYTTELPLIVLINRGSASGSEIVAGYVKDTDRGKLLGTQTFGKGTVQSVFPLNDGSALRLTTARYYTTGENLIDEVGIEPDYELFFEPQEEDPEEDNQLDTAIEAINYYMEEGSWPEPDGFLPEQDEEEFGQNNDSEIEENDEE
ncbi:MAG: S41 family peptidase [Bacillota bacterium]